MTNKDWLFLNSRDDLRLRGKVMYFARIGKRYIINLNLVFQINVLKHRLVLSDFHQCTYALDVSKDALKKLKELMVQ